MDHNDIRHKLSEYMDGSVTPDEKAAIEEHLKTCNACSDALHELRKTVEHIKSVEEIEPPAWMTQKIMATVRSESERGKSLFQRLFSPLFVKLPIQAVAVLFLAVTAYYLYQNINPVERYTRAPFEDTEATQQTPPTISPPPEPKIRREPAAPVKKVPQSPEYKSLDMKYEYEKPAPPVALGKAAESVSAAAPEKSFEPPHTAEGDRVDTMSQESRSLADKGKAAPVMGLTAGVERRTEGTAFVARAKSAAANGEASAVDVTIKVKELGIARKEIEKAVTASGGRIVRTEPSDGKSMITISINGNRLAELLSKLKTIGDLKENAPARIDDEEYLTIRVTLTIN